MREEWEKWKEGERGTRDRWVEEVAVEGEMMGAVGWWGVRQDILGQPATHLWSFPCETAEMLSTGNDFGGRGVERCSLCLCKLKHARHAATSFKNSEDSAELADSLKRRFSSSNLYS